MNTRSMTYTPSQQEGRLTIKGLEHKLLKLAIFVRDKWENTSDTFVCRNYSLGKLIDKTKIPTCQSYGWCQLGLPRRLSFPSMGRANRMDGTGDIPNTRYLSRMPSVLIWMSMYVSANSNSGNVWQPRLIICPWSSQTLQIIWLRRVKICRIG